jgi:hypothetical protein
VRGRLAVARESTGGMMNVGGVGRVTSFGQRSADWVAVAVGGATGIALAYAALFQVGTDGVPVGIALASILTMLAAVSVLWLLKTSSIVRGLASGVAVGWAVVVGGVALPSASPRPESDQVEARLRQIASSTDTPIYYLGAGQGLVISYGEACDGDTCASTIEIVINPQNVASDPTRPCRIVLVLQPQAPCR